MADASRSKSVPVVVRTSQPRPTVTAVRPGASLVSETLPPLDRLTAIAGVPSFVKSCVRSRSYSYPYERGAGSGGSTSLYFLYPDLFSAGGGKTGGRGGAGTRPWTHVRSLSHPRFGPPSGGRASVAVLAVVGAGRTAR